jgi:primosomal replication protein N
VNQLVVNACIAEASPLRYTPAGIPAIDLRLEHQSGQTEMGQVRQVALAIKAVAFGEQAHTLSRKDLGSLWQFTGFLVTPRGFKHIVFHIQNFQPISFEGPHHGNDQEIQ